MSRTFKNFLPTLMVNVEKGQFSQGKTGGEEIQNILRLTGMIDKDDSTPVIDISLYS